MWKECRAWEVMSLFKQMMNKAVSCVSVGNEGRESKPLEKFVTAVAPFCSAKLKEEM